MNTKLGNFVISSSQMGRKQSVGSADEGDSPGVKQKQSSNAANAISKIGTGLKQL
jgi:hypothetical protein